MSDGPLGSDDLNDRRISQRRARRTSEMTSNLCMSWFRAGADIMVGAFHVASDVSEDLTDLYCDRPQRRRPAPADE